MTDLSFSVLRPWAFVFIPPVVLFILFGLRGFKSWSGVVEANLLRSLSTGIKTSVETKAKKAAAVSACLCVLAALAGVSVAGTERALYEPKSPAVIVLDMSLSMRAVDVSPNRFSRAVFKVYDLLNELKGVPTGFVVFTDEPYQLVPTTTEKGVVENMLPLLHFGLMPSQGSRLDRAIAAAVETLEESGAAFGDIFLITDGGDEVFELRDKAEALVKSAAKKGSRLFVVGVGTTTGGAVLQKENTPVFDALGNPVTHRLHDVWLRHLAAIGNGAYVSVSSDGADIAFLKQKYRYQTGAKADMTDGGQADTGYWFLILPALLFPFLFGRGRLVAVLLLFSASAKADFINLFLSPSMAVARQTGAGKTDAAVETAERSKDFTALYNVGTRLILDGNYARAVLVLEQAVALRPDDENAQINLEIARRLNKNPPRDSEGNGNGENDGDHSGNEGGGGSSNEDETGDGSDNSENDDSENGGDANQNGNSPQDDEKEQNGGDNGDGGDAESRDGSNDQSDNVLNERENDDQNDGQGGGEDGGDMIPVHEDPAALLKYKILFQYYENRFDGEPEIGAKW